VAPNIAEVDEAVNRAEHVVGGHLLLKRELLKQNTLMDLPLTIITFTPASITVVNR
jgi:hypothetical protein